MRGAVSILVSFVVLSAFGCASSSSSTDRGSAASPTARASSDPLYSLTLMRQGSILLQQEQYKEALKRFEEADRIAPGNATVHNMIGLCYLKVDRYDKALTSFNTALDLIPSFTDARNNRGATYLALGQYRLAEVDFLAVLGDSTYPHRWSVYYNIGMTYLRRGQVAAAEENFLRAIVSPQPVFDAYLRAAQIAHDQGRSEEGVDLLEEARLSFPERPEASLHLGRLLMELGRSHEARPYLEEVIANQPGSDIAEEAEALLEAF
jgi:tetratricopeptide (TPR) repeat protein